MTKARKGFVAIIIALAVIVTGIVGYDYYQTNLENGAYEFLEKDLYGTFSDLDVTNIESVGSGYYDIGYTYVNGDGRTIIGESYKVKLM